MDGTAQSRPESDQSTIAPTSPFDNPIVESDALPEYQEDNDPTVLGTSDAKAIKFEASGKAQLDANLPFGMKVRLWFGCKLHFVKCATGSLLDAAFSWRNRKA